MSIYGAEQRMRVDRIKRDARYDLGHKRLNVWNYILTNELQAGSSWVHALPGGQLYLVTGASNEVIKISMTPGASWSAYLNTVYGVVGDDQYASTVHKMAHAYAQRSGIRAEVRRFAAYDRATHTPYLSTYDGQAWKIDGETITKVQNGEDNVFFANDDVGIPLDGDPDIGPHGLLLDRLTSPNFAPTGLSGITAAQQKRALTMWMFALAFPDLLPHKPLLLLEGVMGAGKCLGRGTPVLMFDGSVKPVEEIQDGELVMGPDSMPRHVGGVTRGHGPLYKINPTKGASWICNEAHILTVALSGHRNKRGEVLNRGAIVDAPLQDFSPSQWGSHLGRDYALLVRSKIDFQSTPVDVEPYLVGLWLGDGSVSKASLDNPEPEIRAYCENVGPKYGLQVSVTFDQRNALPKITFTSGQHVGQARAGRNTLLTFFNERCFVDAQKRIPREYLINDRSTRLAMLAGLLDTDGYYGNGYYEIITKYAGLRDDILFLARSLGFAAYSTEKIGTIKKTGFEGLYQRITISGELDEIPCLVPRKKAKPRRQVKNVLHTGFRIEPIGDGDFYGFTLDGDGRFLLGDFTVTHNTACVELIQLALKGDRDAMVLQRNKEDDFGVVLLRSPIALFDNTDSYIEWVPDAIAAYLTGVKWKKRKLFTDEDQLIIKPHAFVSVATRNPSSFRRDDVADRCVILRFDRWPTFTLMDLLHQEIKDRRQALFGEYLWFVGQITATIRSLGGLPIAQEQFRMADFAAFGRIVGRVLGWTNDQVSETFVALQGERDAFINEDDPLVDLLALWVGYKTKFAPSNIGRLVTGPVLHAELETFASGNNINWKDSPRTLAQKLRSTHIEREYRIEIETLHAQKHYRIWRNSDVRLELVPDDSSSTEVEQ